MKLYLDTSFIVAVVIDDAHSQKREAPLGRDIDRRRRQQFGVDRIQRRRLARRSNEGADECARTALDDFDLICASCGSYALRGTDFELALRLVRDFSTKLGTPDALHLASAINLEASLVTFDARLAEAAALRSLRVVELG